MLIQVQQNTVTLNTLLQSEQLRADVLSLFKTADVLWNFGKAWHAIRILGLCYPSIYFHGNCFFNPKCTFHIALSWSLRITVTLTTKKEAAPL